MRFDGYPECTFSTGPGNSKTGGKAFFDGLYNTGRPLLLSGWQLEIQDGNLEFWTASPPSGDFRSGSDCPHVLSIIGVVFNTQKHEKNFRRRGQMNSS